MRRKKVIVMLRDLYMKRLLYLHTKNLGIGLHFRLSQYEMKADAGSIEGYHTTCSAYSVHYWIDMHVTKTAQRKHSS